MILNSSIWHDVITAAKAATANAPEWSREVERCANVWDVQPVVDQMAAYVADILRRHFAHYRVIVAE